MQRRRTTATSLTLCVLALSCASCTPRPAAEPAWGNGDVPGSTKVAPSPDKAPTEEATGTSEETDSPTKAEPEPAPPPPLFEGQERVTVSELITELDKLVVPISESDAVRADYEALLAAKKLEEGDMSYLDYVRIKIAFEATRGGGWWHLEWKITNKSPNSTRIWEIWSEAEPPVGEAKVNPTATAECDELSALFAYVVHRMGVKDVGLFWPRWNHTVAVWTLRRGKDEKDVRIVIPTSQIFLGPEESLGTTEFNPRKQRRIYDYRKLDVKPSFEIPVDLARFFVAQVEKHGRKSQAQLQQERNLRDRQYPEE